MATLVDLQYQYIKKKKIKYISEEYIHTYADGSQIVFTIETADKDITLYDEGECWDVNVPTKQLMVTVETDTFSCLDWFDGKRFKTIKSAIRAIQKDLKKN